MAPQGNTNAKAQKFYIKMHIEYKYNMDIRRDTLSLGPKAGINIQTYSHARTCITALVHSYIQP